MLWADSWGLWPMRRRYNSECWTARKVRPCGVLVHRATEPSLLLLGVLFWKIRRIYIYGKTLLIRFLWKTGTWRAWWQIWTWRLRRNVWCWRPVLLWTVWCISVVPDCKGGVSLSRHRTVLPSSSWSWVLPPDAWKREHRFESMAGVFISRRRPSRGERTIFTSFLSSISSLVRWNNVVVGLFIRMSKYTIYCVQVCPIRLCITVRYKVSDLAIVPV